MNKLGLSMAICLLFAGCGAQDNPFGLGGWGKAEGPFNAVKKTLDFKDKTTDKDSVAGSSAVVYGVELKANDSFRVVVTRKSDNLKPAAYLYPDATTDEHIVPSPFAKTDTDVTLEYKITETGTGKYYIAVKTREGTMGDYEIVLTCLAGPCKTGGSPVPNDPNAVASRCLQGVFKCAFAALPNYNGYVGDYRAKELFDSCLTQTATSLNISCDNACVGDDQQRVCDEMKEDFIFYADFYNEQDKKCLSIATSCYASCEGYTLNAYYEFKNTPAYACWVGGFASNCDTFARKHKVCGGTELEENGADRCYEECKATEGAYTEAPWGCTEDCDDVCRNAVAECQYGCEESGMGTDAGCINPCLTGWNSSKCIKSSYE